MSNYRLYNDAFSVKYTLKYNAHFIMMTFVLASSTAVQGHQTDMLHGNIVIITPWRGRHPLTATNVEITFCPSPGMSRRHSTLISIGTASTQRIGYRQTTTTLLHIIYPQCYATAVCCVPLL